MKIVMLIVGLVLVVAGLLTLGFGIPIKDFSFGNTLIITAAMSLGSGFVVVALALVLGELQRITARLEGSSAGPQVRSLDMQEAALTRPVPAPSPPFPATPAPSLTSARAEPLSPYTSAPQSATRPAPAAAHGPDAAEHGAEPASSPPPWARDSRRPVADLPDETHAPSHENEPDDQEPVPSKPSLAERFGFPSRREHGQPLDWKRPPASAAAHREPSSEHDDQSHSRAPSDAVAPPSFAAPSNARPFPREGHAPQAGERPRDFDMLWPESRRQRDAVPEQNNGAPSLGGQMRPGEPAPPTPASVLKSGTVEGMNYTLYSDGSIEAHLPEGTLRFASINDLREHLEQRPR